MSQMESEAIFEFKEVRHNTDTEKRQEKTKDTNETLRLNKLKPNGNNSDRSNLSEMGEEMPSERKLNITHQHTNSLFMLTKRQTLNRFDTGILADKIEVMTDEIGATEEAEIDKKY